MKVLHIGKYYDPFKGGIESVCQDLCEGLVNEGHHVEMICANHEEGAKKSIVNGVVVHRLPCLGRVLGQPLIFSLFSKVKELASSFDLVHIHSPHPMAELAGLFVPKEIPLVVTHHSDVIKQKALLPLYRPIYRSLLKRARSVYVATKNHIDHSTFLPEFKGKCESIPFGIDPAPFKNTIEIAGISSQYRQKYGRFSLFVGRLVSYKGLDVLIKASKKSGTHIVIVGKGPLEKELKGLVEKEGLEHQVHLLGRVDSHKDLVALFHACNNFVLPSVTPNENFGMVQLEAMACAKAVITTKLESGVPLVGLENKTSLLVAPGDVGELSNALKRLDEDYELCKSLGEAGQRRFSELYIKTKMISGHLENYEKIIELHRIIEKHRAA